MNTTTELADRYLAAWNEADDTARRVLIAETYTETATYLDPMLQGEGHDGINAMIAAAQGQFPGYRFQRVGDVQVHHDRTRFSWELMSETGCVALAGTDIAIVREGRLHDVVGFFDTTPEGGR